MESKINAICTPKNIIEKMLSDNNHWDIISRYIQDVLIIKKKEEN